MRTKTIKAISIAIAMSQSGCKRMSDAFSQHTAREIVPTGYKTWWHDTDPQVVIKLSQMESIAHPMVERLQTWTDAMDTAARNTQWGRKHMIGAVPKPKVVILNTDQANAYSSGVCVKYSTNVILKGEKETQPVACIHVSGEYVRSREDTNDCVSGNSSLLGDALKLTNAQLEAKGSTCRAELTANGGVEFVGCPKNFMGNSYSAPAFCMEQTTNIIAVFKGLLNYMPEENVVSVMAHELGHYYKAHASKDESGFFYFERDFKKPERPQPIKDDALVKDIRETVRLSGQIREKVSFATKLEPQALLGVLSSNYYPGPEQRNSVIFEEIKKSTAPRSDVKLADVLLKKCQLHHAEKNNCAVLGKILEKNAIDSLLFEYPYWLTEQITLFQELEQAVLAFSRDILVSTPATPGLVPLESKMITHSDTVVSWPERIDAQQKLYFKRLGEQAVMQVKLYDYLRVVSEFLASLRAADEARIAGFRNQGIGWYTSEQEADEVAPELLASVGIDPSVQQSADLQFLKLEQKLRKEKGLNTTGLDYDKCKELSDRRFGFGTPNIDVLGLTDWFDPHHDSCYRAFNTAREIFLHKYSVENEKRPRFKDAWDTLLNTLPPTPKVQPASAEKARGLSVVY